MGVPKFFRWISERYPCLSEVVKEYQIPEFDNLYLDMNGIIHMCSHPNDFDPHFRITEEKIFKDIFHYIEVLFRMIQPQKLFFLAVDGVAPRAKMNQQRGRRFRSAKEAEILEQKALERGEVLPSESRFDSNCITPGTEFMVRLHEQLKYFVTYKITTDTQWRSVKVILSGHETPGEGEHKIMDYIRYMKSQPGYDPNTRHCLYGLDADLIMLGLCSHEPHFSLLREEVKYGRKAKQQRTSTPEETKFFLLHLSLMREYLELEFGALKTALSFPFDVEKIIDDWVLMGFLVGNDFIPPLPDMHIINGALPTLYKAYIDVLPTFGGYINEGGTLNLERFKKYMEKLSAFDFEQFRETYADLKYFQGKTGRRLGSKERYSYRNIASKEIGESLEKESIAEKPVADPHLAALIHSTERDLQPELGTLSEEDEDDDPEDWEEYESDEEVNAKALFHLEFRQHKKDYYMTKLEYDTVNSDVLRSQADGYVRAIQWNLHYYYNGVCSWSWFYPHHYAPYISDICNFSEALDLNFDMGKPFFPFQQLLAVLPAASKTLLPLPYQRLMSEEGSPISHFYPSEFRTDLNGKKQEWEAVVLIPFIDEELLLAAMAPCDKRLTEGERRRNSHGPMLIYTYAGQDLGPYEAPQYFPRLKSNHAAVQKKLRDEINVDRSCLVKGLCPNVRLDIYYPGFPTLKHIPHTSSLQKRKVKVFQQPSQGSNMILKIVDQGKPDIKEVASELLGHSISVSWPHLVEAKVVAVSNKEFRYGLQEDSGVKSPCPNIEQLKGTSGTQWTMQCKGIQEQYLNRMGVDVGETNILVHVAPMIGRKYIFGLAGKITLEKQWSDALTAYALQTTVRDIAVHDKSFVQFHTLQEVFPLKSVCFMLGHPHYGAMGEVVDGGAAVKSGRIKVCVSVTPEPNLDSVRKKYQDSNIHYMPGSIAAQRLGLSSHLVSRVTGTIYIVQGDKNATMESCNKVNVGLNLKFNKRNEEIPGYTRKEGTVWFYSNKAVSLVQNYMQEFPELFEHLAKHTGNDVFYESDIFSTADDMGVSHLTAITNWLKEQPYTKVERHVCGSEILEAEFVQAIEKEVVEFKQHGCRGKTVIMQVKPHLLFKPELQVGNLPPDPTANHRLFDRIVNVRDGYTVPLGLKGTVIGIHRADSEDELMYDVVFDKPFPGGLPLNCSDNRGYRLSRPAILNLSHGQRVERLKTVSKPTAVVQPSGNTVVQENLMCAPWNQRGSIGSGSMAPGYSAFASWNNNQSTENAGSYVLAPHVPIISATPFYTGVGNAYPSQLRVGSTVPPQTAFSVGSRQQQNASSSRKAKQQNCNGPVAKVSGLAPSNVTPPPTEFQAIWTQLQKAATSPQKINQSSPQQQKQPVPNPKVGEEPGTELLKKMLRITDDPSTPISPRSTSQQVLPPHQHSTKQVSVEEMFKHAQVTAPSTTKENTPGYCVQLLNTFQQKECGIPRYNYFNKEDGSVQAQVVLPDKRTFTGEWTTTREQASENAARLALSQLSLDSDQQNSGLSSSVGKPGTSTLPIPPQQWYQHQQQQLPFPTQTFQHQQHSRQDSVPDWWRGPGREMIPTAGPPGATPFTRQPHQYLPPPPPYMYASYQPQHQQHWRGSGAAGSSTSWRQGYQQQPVRDSRQQELWHGGGMNNSWRQPPVEELQRQFIPLQAVKQQRNRLLGAPLQALPQQHGSRAWPYQQQNPPLPTESTCTTKESPVVDRPNSVAAKPIVPRPKKHRLAANFSVNVSDMQ